MVGENRRGIPLRQVRRVRISKVHISVEGCVSLRAWGFLVALILNEGDGREEKVSDDHAAAEGGDRAGRAEWGAHGPRQLLRREHDIAGRPTTSGAIACWKAAR